MADYLLKGAKMLAKTCPVCHAPLFEYKGERFCVLCANNPRSEDNEEKPPAPLQEETTAYKEPVIEESHQPRILQSAQQSSVEEAITASISILSQRMAAEPDPSRCLIYMQTIREGAEAIRILRGE
ncbi:Sjogren's syndrome/scleroderma autoantigen 1 family protein [Methanocalculus chunghsingensis]|nr:Sjogren's syndrome/scleroderma autoantigen 1 family protein [Methanocalculus chunghsingensis]